MRFECDGPSNDRRCAGERGDVVGIEQVVELRAAGLEPEGEDLRHGGFRHLLVAPLLATKLLEQPVRLSGQSER